MARITGNEVRDILWTKVDSVQLIKSDGTYVHIDMYNPECGNYLFVMTEPSDSFFNMGICRTYCCILQLGILDCRANEVLSLIRDMYTKYTKFIVNDIDINKIINEIKRNKSDHVIKTSSEINCEYELFTVESTDCTESEVN